MKVLRTVPEGSGGIDKKALEVALGADVVKVLWARSPMIVLLVRPRLGSRAVDAPLSSWGFQHLWLDAPGGDRDGPGGVRQRWGEISRAR